MARTPREFLDRYGEETIEGLRKLERRAEWYGGFGLRLRLTFAALATELEVRERRAKEELSGEVGAPVRISFPDGGPVRLKHLPYGKVEECVRGVVSALR